MVELLVIKGPAGYYRFAGGPVECVAVHRATVFPVERQAEAREALARLRRDGISAGLVRLRIEEHPFTDGEENEPIAPAIP